MGLENVPDDLFVEIAHRLSIIDILSIRRVSKRLCQRTRQRSLWFYFVCRASAQHGVGRFPAQYQRYDERQLELVACKPLKFQLSLVNSIYTPKEGQHTRLQHAQKKQARAAASGGVGAHHPPSGKGKERDASRSSTRADHSRPHHRRRSSSSNLLTSSARETLAPLREYNLPSDLYTSIYLVRGGRWLLTISSTGDLRIWDLQPTPPKVHGAQGVTTGDGSQTSNVPSFRLCGQKSLELYWVIMDAEVTSDGCALNIMLNIELHYEPTSHILTLDLLSLTSTEPTLPIPPIRTLASWKHPVQRFARVASSFHGDFAVFRVSVDSVWLWNWKIGSFSNLQLRGPPNGQIIRVKIVSSYLVVIHKVEATKATISLYPLPELHPPTSSVEVHDEFGVQTSSADPSNLPFPEYLNPLFTSSFRSMHHVQDLRARAPTSPGRPSSSGQETPRIMTFRFCSAMISEPFWLVAPGTERPSSPQWDQTEKGIFRLGVAIESWSEGSTRTRLQYFLRVDLNAYAPGARFGKKVSESLEPVLETSLPADVAEGSAEVPEDTPETELIPSPQLRGRMSIKTELVYFEDRLIVAAGKKVVMSLWSSNDGVRSHLSLIGKPDKRFEVCNCNDVDRVGSSKSSRPSSGSSSRQASSHQVMEPINPITPPIQEASEEPPLMGLVALEGNVGLTPLSAEAISSAYPTAPNPPTNASLHAPVATPAPHYREKGVSRLVYPYRPPSPSDTPDLRVLPPPGHPQSSPPRTWQPHISSSFYINMDFFSGRIVLLQERNGMLRETIVKVLEYV